jgi:hypothetical protein
MFDFGYNTYFDLSIFLMAGSAALGYWFGSHGLSGVESDLESAKADIENLKVIKQNVPVTVVTTPIQTTPLTAVTPASAPVVTVS